MYPPQPPMNNPVLVADPAGSGRPDRRPRALRRGPSSAPSRPHLPPPRLDSEG